MEEALVIGLDVGTSSTKAGVYRLDGTAVATAQVPTALRRGAAGEVDQDPEELFASSCDAVAEAVARSGAAPAAIAGLAVTGQMAGVMGIDEAFNAVTPYDSWLDARCTPQLQRLAATDGDLLARRTGCPPMVDHAPKMQWWRDERPETYERIARFVMPAVYVAGRLAGLTAAEAFIDPTYLHFTGVADASTGQWSPELLAALGLGAERLPSIVASEAVVGELTAAGAARCGLRPGTPVIAGAGDTATGALGAGIVRTGQLLDTAGTAAVLLGVVDAFRPDERHGLMIMRGALPGQWLPLNYVAGGGSALHWLERLVTRPAAAAGDETPSLERLLAEAVTVDPGADGLLFVPHLEGRVAPHDPAMRGAWVGLGFGHGRGHLARSIMEAVAFEYAGYLGAMRRLHPGVDFDVVHAIGGGARSDLWNSIKADVLGLPVERVRIEETATRGAALLAAAGVGLVDLGEVAARVPATTRVEPDPARHARYAALTARYAELVETLAGRTPLPSPPERHLV
ncbi:MAG TPA: FGGY family carbohydrate kinase [Baekduia sp.]|nr:FGGY family carbohydrate kinase [Baekduia sp.]